MACKGLIFAAGTQADSHRPIKGVFGLDSTLAETPKIRFTLAVLVQAGVRQAIIGATPENVAVLHSLLGDGGSVGVEISYLLLEADSSIERALNLGSRFIADSHVLLASPGVCCTRFMMQDVSSVPRNGFVSFRMRNGAVGVDDRRPDLLVIGNGSLTRLWHHSDDQSVGSRGVDEFRRTWMNRFKYCDMDLTDRCVFFRVEDGIVIDGSLLDEAVLHELLAIDFLVDADRNQLNLG